jgi:hypothetical protein
MKLIQANEKILVRAAQKAFEERTQEKKIESTRNRAAFFYTPRLYINAV